MMESSRPPGRNRRAAWQLSSGIPTKANTGTVDGFRPVDLANSVDAGYETATARLSERIASRVKFIPAKARR